MILTCPNCATRFFAEDSAIGVGGRRVKCAACGEVWTGKLVSPMQAPSVTAHDEATLPREDGHTTQGKVEEVAPLFAERPAPRRGAKRGGDGRPWALGLLAVVFLILVGGLIFQQTIERTFPGSTALYRSLGLKSAGAVGG